MSQKPGAALTCRSCGSSRLAGVLDLGKTPLADALLTEQQVATPSPTFPLELFFCADCSLVQIGETVPPDVVFDKDYPYYSSFIDAVVQNARENVRDVLSERRLGPGSLAVELASNDGYLLRNFVERGIPVLGIDPAPGPAEAARKGGVPTLCTFFGRDLAEQLRKEGRQADVIFGNNVLAHVADTNGFVEGIRILLKPDGMAVIEVPYVRDLIEKVEFDTIYHEHLCYFSVTSLSHLFRRHGLHLNRVKPLPIHGGSLRIFVEPTERMDESIRSMLAEEAAMGLTSQRFYEDFAHRVASLKSAVVGLLSKLRADGSRIAGYGAAAKGSTLLNYMDIGRDLIEYVVDRNTHKQGKFMPGKHIPIYPTEKLLEDRPDYVFLLAWNHASEIIRQQRNYVQQGGRFVIPIPEPQIVGADLALKSEHE
jgi:SAM-dependent methyltransferase